MLLGCFDSFLIQAQSSFLLVAGRPFPSRSLYPSVLSLFLISTETLLEISSLILRYPSLLSRLVTPTITRDGAGRFGALGDSTFRGGVPSDRL